MSLVQMFIKLYSFKYSVKPKCSPKAAVVYYTILWIIQYLQDIFLIFALNSVCTYNCNDQWLYCRRLLLTIFRLTHSKPPYQSTSPSWTDTLRAAAWPQTLNSPIVWRTPQSNRQWGSQRFERWTEWNTCPLAHWRVWSGPPGRCSEGPPSPCDPRALFKGQCLQTRRKEDYGLGLKTMAFNDINATISWLNCL